MAGLLPIVAGTPGSQFGGTTDARAHPLGGSMVFGDGRRFVYAQNGASTLVPGDVIQAAAPTANHVLQTPTAAAVGDKTVSVALGATAVLLDEYKDGYLAIELGTGFGFAYSIDSHAAVAASGTFAVPLRETVQVAIPATANSVSLIRAPTKLVIQAPGTTLTGGIVGIAMSALTANQYGWLQTKGPAAVTTIGTVIIGNVAVSPTATAGGAGPAAATPISRDVGGVLHVATTTNKSLLDLVLV